MERLELNRCAATGKFTLIVPKWVNRYSSFALQFGANGTSTPAPTVPPVRQCSDDSVVPGTALLPAGMPAICPRVNGRRSKRTRLFHRSTNCESCSRCGRVTYQNRRPSHHSSLDQPMAKKTAEWP